MNRREREAVERTISSIYNQFHQCALTEQEVIAQRAFRPKATWKVGQLCDSCAESVNEHMKAICEATSDD